MLNVAPLVVVNVPVDGFCWLSAAQLPGAAVGTVVGTVVVVDVVVVEVMLVVVVVIVVVRAVEMGRQLQA